MTDLFISGPSLVLNDRLYDDDRETGLILRYLPKALSSEVLRHIAKAWDLEVLPGLAAVPEEDTRALGLELAHEANLHSVK